MIVFTERKVLETYKVVYTVNQVGNVILQLPVVHGTESTTLCAYRVIGYQAR